MGMLSLILGRDVISTSEAREEGWERSIITIDDEIRTTIRYVMIGWEEGCNIIMGGEI